MSNSEYKATGSAPLASAPRIWLLQDGEPLPTDDQARLMRTATLAQALAASGADVTWWASRFHHALKRFRSDLPPVVEMEPRYRIRLLDGAPYPSNLSPARIRHYRQCAAHFLRTAARCEPPDLVLGSYPSPELCDAGREYATARRIPFVVDIRDPWPDIFEEYFPSPVRWTLAPVLWHYRRRIRRIAHEATGIIAVSRAMLRWGLDYAGRAAGPNDRVIYIGFPCFAESRFVTVPAAFTPAEPLRCALVSSCGRSYDGALVIDAARRLAEAGDHRVHVLITGEGEMRAEWMARAAGLPNVSFTGFISHDELQQHVRRTHVGLTIMRGGITRFWMGNKIFEYLSGSLAIVNNVPGEAADVVREHDVGLSVPPDDAARLAAALAQAADAPARVSMWMRNAGRVFAERFERGRVYQEYVRYLRHLAAPSTPSADRPAAYAR